MDNPILIEVTRGGRVESVHRGAVAVSDAKGRLAVRVGDVETPVFPRSALKPVQAVTLVESGAAEAMGLSDREIALACASHSGQPMHTDRILAWLERIGCAVADLACGPQRPAHEPTATQMIRDGVRWSELHNNCSGKHTGFMTTARRLGADVAGYQLHDHKVQRLVESTLAEMAGLPGDLPWGVDGCTVPNFAVPLSALARAMARFADSAGQPATRAAACQTIIRAMVAHPELVAGSGAPGVLLMRQQQGLAIKIGAEGVYVAMIPSQGLGVAVKIEDGATRGAESAIAALLIALRVLPDEGAAADLAHGPVTNTRKAVVGERRATQALSQLT